MIDLAKMKQSVGLTTPIGKLRDLHDRLCPILENMTPEEQQCMLLIMERLVIGKLGHKCTIKFGENVWNGQHCCICNVPLEQEGQAVWFISRWEKTSVMLCLCEEHSKETFEVDVDILTGALRSQIGYP